MTSLRVLSGGVLARAALRGATTSQRCSLATLPATTTDYSAFTPKPKVHDTPDSQLQFDQKTHTGQAWDKEDYRSARFIEATKQVNPNIAMYLVAKEKPIAIKGRVASCDGGGGALGHPKVFINLDKPGNHGCGYCGLRFYKEGQANDGSNHINV